MKKNVERPISKLAKMILFIFALTFSGCNNLVDSDEDQYSEHLYLKTYDISKMTNEDFEICNQAEIRIGVYVEDGHYKTKASCGSQINISEDLYNFLKTQYETADKLDYKDMMPRTKSSDEEQVKLYVCVPAAISHMGVAAAPEFQEAVDECCRQDPDYNIIGYFKTSLIGDVIRHFCSDADDTHLGTISFDIPCGEDTLLDNIVVVYEASTCDHAINVYKYKRGITKNLSTLYYEDYTSDDGYDVRGSAKTGTRCALGTVSWYPFK